MIYPHQLFSNPSDSWQRRVEDHRRVLIEGASGHDMRPQMGRTGHTGPPNPEPVCERSQCWRTRWSLRGFHVVPARIMLVPVQTHTHMTSYQDSTRPQVSAVCIIAVCFASLCDGDLGSLFSLAQGETTHEVRTHGDQ